MPIVPTGTASDPVYYSNNTGDDCDAAKLTAITSLAIAVLWYGERSDAIEKQDTIENEILDLFEKKVKRYVDVDLPRQLEAIRKGLDTPECEVTCSSCLKDVSYKVVTTIDQECLRQEDVDSFINAGIALLKSADSINAKTRWAECVASRQAAISKALNLSMQTYLSGFGYLANASAIQSSLAGMAGAAYAQAIGEFSYALGMIGRINNSAGNYSNPSGTL